MSLLTTIPDISLLTSATSSNTPNTLVKRDGEGDFSAGTITATTFLGDGRQLNLTPLVMQADANNRGLFIRDKDTVASNEANNALLKITGSVGNFLVNSEGGVFASTGFQLGQGESAFGLGGLLMLNLPIRWNSSAFGPYSLRLNPDAATSTLTLDDGAGSAANLYLPSTGKLYLGSRTTNLGTEITGSTGTSQIDFTAAGGGQGSVIHAGAFLSFGYESRYTENIALGSARTQTWATTDAYNGTVDLRLRRSAANTLTLDNGSGGTAHLAVTGHLAVDLSGATSGVALTVKGNNTTGGNTQEWYHGGNGLLVAAVTREGSVKTDLIGSTSWGATSILMNDGNITLTPQAGTVTVNGALAAASTKFSVGSDGRTTITSAGVGPALTVGTTGGVTPVQVWKYNGNTSATIEHDGFYVGGNRPFMRSSGYGSYAGMHVDLADDNHIRWTNFADNYTNYDTGLKRESAGVLKVTDGSTGYGGLKAASLASDTANFNNAVTCGETLTVGYRITQTVQTATSSGGSLSVDASYGNEFRIDVTENITVYAPSNPVDGQGIVYRFKQDVTGGWNISFDGGVFRFAGGTPPSFPTTASKAIYVATEYVAADGMWDVIGISGEF
jgi:hypothetical protein